jgi:hypothetical protein
MNQPLGSAVTRQDFNVAHRLVSRPAHPLGGAPRQSDDGVTVLISTPYMDEARCHRVAFMRHGRIIAECAITA